MTTSSEPRRLTRFIPSGRIHPLTVLLVVVFIVPAALLAWPYQWNEEFLAAHGGRAVIVASFFVPLLGALAGGLAWIAVERGRCRNPKVGLGIGGLLGLVALLASHYIAYRDAAGGYTDVSLAEYLEAATATGWTFIPSDTPDISGVMVYLMWALEAGIVLGISGWLGRTAAREPYCESCGRWANEKLGKATIRSPGTAGLDQIRTAASVAALLHVPPPGPDAGGELGKDELIYTLKGCNRCDGTATLTVEWIPVKLGIKRQERRFYEALQEDVALDGEEARSAAVLIGCLGPHGESSRPTARTFARTD